MLLLPVIRDMITNTKKTKNRILAMVSVAVEIPPNPKNAAIMASITKIIVHFNMMRLLSSYIQILLSVGPIY